MPNAGIIRNFGRTNPGKCRIVHRMSAAGIKPYVWMLCGCAWFAAMSLMARAAGQLTDWQIVAVIRSLIATLFALMLARAQGVSLVFLRPRTLWWRSLAGSGSMVATFYSLSQLEASDVLTLTNTFPAWVALLSWPLAGERPTKGVLIAIVLAIVGVTIVTQSQASESGHTFQWFSVATALIAAFFTALAMLGLNRLQGVASMAVVVHFSAVATVVCLASLFIFPSDRKEQTEVTWNLGLLLLGTGITAAIGQVFLTKAYRAGPATKVSVVSLSQVVMVMVFEAIAWSRSFHAAAIFGTCLVLGPTAWLMIRERKKPADPG